MKAIILAAGKGTRMRPLSDTCPKPLLKVGGRPLLYHIVQALPAEVDELVIVTGYLGEQIRSHCGDQYLGRKIHYMHQEKQLGNYHALKLAKSHILDGERFFVFYADDLHGADGIKACLDYPRAMTVTTVEDPRRFGVVQLNEDGTLRRIVEKPKNPMSNLVSPGVFLFDHHIFEYEADLDVKGEYFLTTAVQKMIRDYPIYTVHSDFWFPIAYPEDLSRAERMLKEMSVAGQV